MSLEQALAIVKAAGFHISKPRTKSRTAERPALNAIGKPFSSQYDPNRNLKHKTSSGHLFAPYPPDMRFAGDPEDGAYRIWKTSRGFTAAYRASRLRYGYEE